MQIRGALIRRFLAAEPKKRAGVLGDIGRSVEELSRDVP